jgi:hypothetical protein
MTKSAKKVCIAKDGRSLAYIGFFPLLSTLGAVSMKSTAQGTLL